MMPQMSEVWSDKSEDGLKLAAVQVIYTETAAIEGRLRDQAVELMAPTIKRAQLLDQKLKEVKASVDDQYEDVAAMKRLLEGANAQHQMLENFRVEIAKKMSELQGFEQQVSTRISHQETQVNSIRQSLEAKAGEAATFSRSIESLSKALAESREENTEVRKYTVSRVDTAEDRVSKLRDEFETRMLQVEDRIQNLYDMQMGTTGAMGHVKAESEKTNHLVQACVSSVTELAEKKASIVSVHELREETKRAAEKVSHTMNTLEEQFTAGLQDIKAHLQTATETAGSSAAMQMQLMRTQYDEDMKRLERSSHELEVFMEKSRGLVEENRTELSRVRELAEEGLADLRHLLSQTTTVKVKGLQDLDLSLSQLRARQVDTEELLGEQVRKASLRTDVLQILVEAAVLSTVLDKQDDQDRKNMALFGYKAERTESPRDKAAASSSLPELTPNRSPRKRPNEGAPFGSARGNLTAPSTDCVVTLDQRCLSCSGSPSTVLAGFKMACLQYHPAPVEHKRRIYSRAELIQERMDLLLQAKDHLAVVE